MSATQAYTPGHAQIGPQARTLGSRFPKALSCWLSDCIRHAPSDKALNSDKPSLEVMRGLFHLKRDLPLAAPLSNLYNEREDSNDLQGA